METIEVLVREHDYINRMLRVIRKLSYNLMEDLDYDLEDFYLVTDFIKDYADQHHHKKEEALLFVNMKEASPSLRESGAITTMYVEHDMGRLYLNNLLEALGEYSSGDREAKLDIISSSIAYADLLDRHIFKENSSFYVFAQDVLSPNMQALIDRETRKIEEEAREEGLQARYLKVIEHLEEKYL